MNPLRVVESFLKEIAFAALRALDCHCELVHCRVEEADQQESLSVSRVGIPEYGHDCHGVTDEDETKDDAVKQ